MAKRDEDPEVLRLVVGFLRLFARLAQRQFADASGLQQVDISHYESGKHRPREKNLQRMAAAAGFPWGLVGPLRRFFAALLAAIRFGRQLSSSRGGRAGSGSTPLDLDKRAVLDSAWAAVAAYCSEEEAAAAEAEHRRQCPEALFREAGETWEALKRFPVGRRRQVALLLPTSVRNWPLAEQACEASLKAAADSPEEALDSAALALDVAELLLGDESKNVRLAWCWGHVGNARRVVTDFDGADEAFARAWQLWHAGDPHDPLRLPKWHLFSLEASLRRAQRRFQQALDLLDQALGCSYGDPAAIARCLLKKEHVFEMMGDIPAALAALAEAAPHVEASGDPDLLFAHRFKTANNLCHLQRFSEAAERLPEIAELAKGAELTGLRVAWLTSRVAAGQGRKAEALSGLGQVRQRFTDLKLPYEAALSSLEIAVLWLEDGRTAEVQALALTMAWIFDAKRIRREALAALKLFRDAAEQEEATAELARRVIADLEKAGGSAPS
jgi:transcriptional regulator with XRE-family HTH domain